MAEAIARDLIRRRGWTHVEVKSAGTGAVPGVSASPEAVDVAREKDLDLGSHSSQPLSADLVAWADLVLTMGASHMYVVRELGGAEKAALVTDFIEGAGFGAAVADPFGGDHAAYRQTFTQLEAAVTALLDRLEPILSP